MIKHLARISYLPPHLGTYSVDGINHSWPGYYSLGLPWRTFNKKEVDLVLLNGMGA